jgi:hypothetical protein
MESSSTMLRNMIAHRILSQEKKTGWGQFEKEYKVGELEIIMYAKRRAPLMRNEHRLLVKDCLPSNNRNDSFS